MRAVTSSAVLVAFRCSMALSRSCSLTFDDAWATAIREVREVEWVAALGDTRDAWAAAYYELPATAALVALHAVAHDDDREPEAEPVTVIGDPLRRCKRCEEPIPDNRDRRARYCSHECQRATHRPAGALALVAPPAVSTAPASVQVGVAAVVAMTPVAGIPAGQRVA